MSDAAVPHDTTPGRVGPITDTTVAGWMARQRWYAAKGLDPLLRVIARVDAALGDVVISTRFIIDDAPAEPVLYQVPLTERTAPVPGLEHALVASDGRRWLYDAPHDAAYARWLLDVMSAATVVDGSDAVLAGRNLVAPGHLTDARVLRGEQSNTSIICDVDGGPVEQVIVKVFRVLHHGDNPDVTTQAALSTGGSHRVPASFGSIRATWPDVGRLEGTAHGHVAFAQEFLPGLEDAWRVALRAASEGVSFAGRARELGLAVAEVHRVLAEQLPTQPPSPSLVDEVIASMQTRLEMAARDVPAVAQHADAIRRILERTRALEWPVLQRIHGDLHLGQALDAPGRGWVLLDFEGEPLRPMPERSRPDVPLRDVAGMLRSFDYVAGALAHADPPVQTGDWAHDARHAFVDGYIEGIGFDIRAQRALLDAFEIDKAVYEAVYESRNRPDWLEIPVRAVERLVARSGE